MTFGLGNPLRVAALTLCLAATSPAAAAGAAPSHGVAKAVFKVTVEGVQRTSWQTDHPGTTGCDGASKGTGMKCLHLRPVLCGDHNEGPSRLSWDFPAICAVSRAFVDDPFRNCPSGGHSFPTLVRTDEGAHMRTELPREELFDRSLGKIILVARGKESETAGEHTFLTTIRWVVTFTRTR